MKAKEAREIAEEANDVNYVELMDWIRREASFGKFVLNKDISCSIITVNKLISDGYAVTRYEKLVGKILITRISWQNAK